MPSTELWASAKRSKPRRGHGLVRSPAAWSRQTERIRSHPLCAITLHFLVRLHFPGFRRFLPRLVEQEGERLLGTNLAGDAAQRSVFLQFRPHNGHRLAALARVTLHFAIHFFLRRADGLAIGNLIEDQRRPHIPLGASFLRVANLLPIEFERS